MEESTKVVCSRCGIYNDIGAHVCKNCGASLPKGKASQQKVIRFR